MRDGHCPKCGNQNVYRCNVPSQGGGISPASPQGYMLQILDTYGWKLVGDWETFLCADCGYYENYVLDKALITKVITNPKGSAWQKVES
jgi:predicted nucleic-acid-binding Zn-ribbon protein